MVNFTTRGIRYQALYDHAVRIAIHTDQLVEGRPLAITQADLEEIIHMEFTGCLSDHVQVYISNSHICLTLI